MEHSFNIIEFNCQLHQMAAIFNKEDRSGLHDYLHGRKCQLSALQSAHQAMFSKAAEFVLSLTSLLPINNHAFSKPVHLASLMSYILENAIIFTGTGFSIDYRKVLVTHGFLPRAEVAHAKPGSGCINFAWTNYSKRRIGSRNDKAILVAYSESLNKCVYTVDTARRCDEEAIMEVLQFHGDKVQTWLSFISTKGTFISDSVYAGEVTVT